MSLTEACSNLLYGIGRFVGESSKAFTSARKALRESKEKLRSLSSRERIRHIVEELTRLGGKGIDFTTTELKERLQVMGEIILALQKKIDGLSARGSVGEADMWKAVGSMKAAESLTDDERAVLVSVFRRNMALQKQGLFNEYSVRPMVWMRRKGYG